MTWQPVCYQPRGSMCAECQHRDRDCSGLPFSDMPVLEMGRGAGDRIYAAVRCTEYVKGLPA